MKSVANNQNTGNILKLKWLSNDLFYKFTK